MFTHQIISNKECDLNIINTEIIYILETKEVLEPFMNRFLEESGYLVKYYKSISSLKLAIDCLKPDVLIVDIPLTTINRQKLSELDLNSMKISAIYITETDDFRSRMNIVKSGGNNCLIRPITKETIADKIEFLIEEKKNKVPHVMVVDDDKFLGDLYVKAIKKTGIDAINISDLENLMIELKRKCPDAILMDLHMPWASGDEVIKVLRQFKEYKNIPIILITSDEDKGFERDILDLVEGQVLLKPIDPKILAETIPLIIDKNKN